MKQADRQLLAATTLDRIKALGFTAEVKNGFVHTAVGLPFEVLQASTKCGKEIKALLESK